LRRILVARVNTSGYRRPVIFPAERSQSKREATTCALCPPDTPQLHGVVLARTRAVPMNGVHVATLLGSQEHRDAFGGFEIVII
jgi:hypothetical protein